MRNAGLGAVCFKDGQDVDALFKAIADTQMALGQKVFGVLQARGLSTGECHCADMDLQAFGSGKVFRISQSLGQHSAGCRLHPGALAECSAYLQQQISGGCDLLMLNRFGKGESEGRGFRDLIGIALERGIPVLTAMRETYKASFMDFAGDLGVELPFDPQAIENWIGELEQAHAA